MGEFVSEFAINTECDVTGLGDGEGDIDGVPLDY